MSKKLGKAMSVISCAFVLLLGFVYAVGPSAAQQKGEPVKLLLLGYGEGSAGTIMTAKVGEMMLNELPPGSTVKTTTGSSIGNLHRVAQKQVEIAATVATFVAAAQKKEEPIAQGLPNVRIIGKQAKGGSPFYIVARKEAGVTTLQDLKTKPVKLIVREKGSTGEFFATKVLAAHGITYDDIKKRGGDVVFAGNTEAVNRMQDGNSDVWICIGAYPFGPLLELSRAKPMVLISYDRKIIDDFQRDYIFAIEDIPAGTYTGQDKPYIVNGSVDVWATRDDVPDAVVTAFLDAIRKNEKDFRAVHKYAQGFDWKDSAATPYLHKAATKFYQDHGYLAK